MCSSEIGGSNERGQVSSLEREIGYYIMEMLESASTINGAPSPGGSYTWVVGIDGEVFAAYKGSNGYWYAGFRNTYP